MQGGIDPELPGTAYFDLAARGEEARARHARARVQPDGDRQRRQPHRPVVRGLPDQGTRVRARHRSPAPPRRSSTTTSAGCSPRASCRRRPGSRWSAPRTGSGLPSQLDDDVRPRRQPAALGAAPARAQPDPGRDRRVHRVRAAAVRAHQRADLPGRRGPPGPDAARQPRGARGGADHAARPDRQHPVLVGQARRRRHPGDAAGGRQRPRRHPDGGDDLPDGRLRARLRKTVEELVAIAAGIGRPVAQRTTTYGAAAGAAGSSAAAIVSATKPE